MAAAWNRVGVNNFIVHMYSAKQDKDTLLKRDTYLH